MKRRNNGRKSESRDKVRRPFQESQDQIRISGREGEKGSDSGWVDTLREAPVAWADGVDVGYERRVENRHAG